MSNFGNQSMVNPLERVAVRRPDATMAAADPTLWHYDGALDIEKLSAAHMSFTDTLESHGAEVIYVEGDAGGSADAVFTHDASMVTNAGAVIMRMGKSLRRGEEALHRAFYRSHDIPILGEIKEPGTIEAGDTLWLDAETLLVGEGYRTNRLGAKQLAELLNPLGIQVRSYDMPSYMGPKACLHLMSIVSMLSDNLALVYEPLAPVNLLRLFNDRGIQIISTPIDEFEETNTISLNVLTTAPMRCIMSAGAPKTAELLQDSGCQVDLFEADELCVKAEGGPTCMTRPIKRSA